MKLKILKLLLITCLNIINILAQSDNNQVNYKSMCNAMPKLDVLPGKGWDSLRNTDMGQVTAITYNQCKTTPDGKLLIPDNAFTIPLKQSDVQLFSEIINKWSNYTSITSQSFNLDVSYDKGIVSISGSFSSDYENTKQKQVNEKATTFRVHARYTMYVIGTVPTANLDQQLVQSFRYAIEALEQNDTMKADLILELIVRDYGTHLITRMDAGGIILKEDFVNRVFVNSYSSSVSDLKAAASASFFNIFRFDASYQQSVSESLIAGYKQSTTSSSVSTFGGLFFKPNQSINDWIDSIPKNLVGIDRRGDPLQFVITPQAFPNVSLNILDKLRTHFTNAILRYYAYNKHIGCMNIDSPNFDFKANTDSHLCEAPLNNYTFGGMYQTCESNGQSDGPYCNGLSLKNPLTGTYSCPKYYESIFLTSGSKSIQNCYTSCHGWWIFKSCGIKCDDYNPIYKTYWCAAVHGNVPNNTGAMFGGVYTAKVDNPLTQSGSCPSTYIDLIILNDLHVCISVDYELGRKYSLDFGGFFSCQSGNPLYTNLKKRVNRLFVSNANSYLDDYVSACPKGYSQHTATIDNNCLVNYCILSGSFGSHGHMPIVLPPFRSFHSLFDKPFSGLQPPGKQSHDERHKMSGTDIAFTVIGCIGLLFILTGVLFWIRRRRARNSLSSSAYVPINGDDSENVNTEES